MKLCTCWADHCEVADEPAASLKLQGGSNSSLFHSCCTKPQPRLHAAVKQSYPALLSVQSLFLRRCSPFNHTLGQVWLLITCIFPQYFQMYSKTNQCFKNKGKDNWSWAEFSTTEIQTARSSFDVRLYDFFFFLFFLPQNRVGNSHQWWSNVRIIHPVVVEIFSLDQSDGLTKIN